MKKRTVVKCIRLTPDEEKRIQSRAESAGVTASEFIRAAALCQHVQARADMTALNELRRQGGLIKHLYNNGADPTATAAALAALSAVAAKLIRE